MATAVTSSIAASSEDWSPAQKEVWATVLARLAAWKNNDYEAYLAIHHDGWHRYSTITSGLLDKADVANFWQGMKRNEKVLELVAKPIAVDIFGDDDVAIAHFIGTEVFKWTGEDYVRPNGHRMEADTVYTVPVRYSDVYVKEGDRWLYIGGYRDLTCDILAESKNSCRE